MNTAARRAWLMFWILVKLVLITAMVNSNAAQFIYAGF
jgi:hypothetical protein